MKIFFVCFKYLILLLYYCFLEWNTWHFTWFGNLLPAKFVIDRDSGRLRSQGILLHVKILYIPIPSVLGKQDNERSSLRYGLNFPSHMLLFYLILQVMENRWLLLILYSRSHFPVIVVLQRWQTGYCHYFHGIIKGFFSPKLQWNRFTFIFIRDRCCLISIICLRHGSCHRHAH